LGDYFIRRGSPLAAVGVKFDDTLTIKWQKVASGKKAPGRETTLDINGVEHTKLGRDHFQLVEPLGFLSIETGGGTFRPQIAGQFDKAFLLDVNDTVVAEVFRVLGRGDVVTNARASAKKDLGRTKDELKVRSEDLDAAKRVVSSKIWVRSLAQNVSSTSDELRVLESIEKTLANVKGLIDEKVPDVVPDAPSCPDLNALLKLLEDISSYQEITVPEVPERVPPKIYELLQETRRCQGEGLELDSREEEITKRLAEAVQLKLQLEKSLGVCPTCGKGFDV
jgi:hypothetical protein